MSLHFFSIGNLDRCVYPGSVMGASHSKSSLDIVNQSIIDVLTTNMNRCNSSINAVQDNTVTGTDIFGRNVQTVSIDQKCTQAISVDNSMIADMANKIQQAANSNSTTLLPGFSGSANTQKLKTFLASKITTQNVQQALASVNAVQINRVEAGGTSISKTNVQSLTSVQTALQTLLNNNKVAQTLTTDSNQSASATTNTNPISQIFSAISGAIWSYILVFILLIVLLIVIVIVYKKLTREPESQSPPVVPMTYEPEELGPEPDNVGPNGELLDSNGTPIYVDANGNEVDAQGNPIQLEGAPVKVAPTGLRTRLDGSPIPSAMIQAVKNAVVSRVPRLASVITPGAPAPEAV